MSGGVRARAVLPDGEVIEQREALAPDEQQWEYLLKDERDAPMYGWALENIGKTGFELVAVIPGPTQCDTRWVFKRKKPTLYYINNPSPL